jgi:diguanylate cyclase (GGDEF)-like protein/PAS domain S-box-containing protein
VTTLESVLERYPHALVGARSLDGTPVPVPASITLRGQTEFTGPGLELVAPDDQLAAIAAWERVQTESTVSIDLHLAFDPDHLVTAYFFDARVQHGVHLIVIVTDEPEAVLAAAAAHTAAARPVAHMRRDGMAVVLEVDEALTRLLGWHADDLVGRRTTEFVHPDDVQRAIDSWMEMRSGSGSGRIRLRYRHAHGHYVWVEVTNRNLLDDPDVASVVSDMVDISAEMTQLEALQDRERLLGRLAEALPIGICHLRPDGEVAYSNEPLTALLGPIDHVETLVAVVAEEDRRAFELALEHALLGHPQNIEVGVDGGMGGRRCELTFRVLHNETGGVDGVIMCAADVTDRSRLRTELEHRATHDALSGCLNRAATMTALERALAEGGRVAVVFMDLDGFKETNDEFGHAAGDELLRVAAARLRGAVRGGDQVGRIGGDEFVVIARQDLAEVDASSLVDRLSKAVNGDVRFARQRIPLRASVGAAVSRDGETDADVVLTRADAAMYEAKRRARLRRSGLRSLSTPRDESGAR